jgi:hypothetical protein
MRSENKTADEVRACQMVRGALIVRQHRPQDGEGRVTIFSSSYGGSASARVGTDTRARIVAAKGLDVKASNGKNEGEFPWY